MAEAAAETLRDMGAPQGHPNTEGDISATPATQAAQPDRSGAVPPDAGAGAAGAGQELTARQLSAQAIIPGSEFTVESVKHWKGGSISKPGLVELREEVTRRSSGARPAAWDMAKCVSHLLKTAPPGQQGTSQPASQPNATTSKQKVKAKARKNPGTKNPQTRFKRAWHLPRILHSIEHNSEHFLKRHNKPENRNQLEAASLKSAWHHIANTANDPDFEPVLFVLAWTGPALNRS